MIDIRSMRFIALWSRKRPLPGDEERPDALLARRLGAAGSRLLVLARPGSRAGQRYTARLARGMRGIGRSIGWRRDRSGNTRFRARVTPSAIRRNAGCRAP